MIRRRSKTLLLLMMMAACAGPTIAAGSEDYKLKIKPLLRERCFACHGALKQESGLRLDTAAFMKAGGDSGSAIEPGEPDASNLLDRVSAEDESERMPPDGKPLTKEEIAILRQWIAAGAPAPSDEVAERDPRDHWAFQPPRASIVQGPPSSNTRNAIDLLLDSNRRAHGLKVVPLVDRSLLLRRLYLDLIGVPPTRDQLQAFLADDSPDAYERVVDRLLASPRYGERWGRHWMDIWRYTDWYGLGKQLRNSQKHIWRWRDWIVESLNDDAGYDEMVRLMLAADEIRPDDQDAIRATGFLARNYYLFNRTTWLDSTIEHTSKSLLGLTVNCAKCHDHKYDAISQNDYYAMRAIFEPHQVRLDPVAGETDLEKDGLPRVFDAHPDAATYLHVRGDAKNPDKSHAIAPDILQVVLPTSFKPQTVKLPPPAIRPALLPFVRDDLLAAAHRDLQAARVELQKAADSLDKAKKQAAKTSAQSNAVSGSGASQQQPQVFADESFDKLPDPSRWTTGPGAWKLEDGKLVQSQDGASRDYLQSIQDNPRDFHAVLEFTTIGGSKWRSVGLSFDTTDSDETMVYVSAVQPGSKLQVSHKRKGQQSYPVTGLVARPIKLNTPYKLELFIKDRLVNVSINGEHALAYTLPFARQAGKIQMVAFDAKVHFDRLRIASLPKSREFVLPKGGDGSGLTLKQLETAHRVAVKKVEAAELYPDAIESALTAERAKLSNTDYEAARKNAIHAHLKWRLFVAEQELAAVNLEPDPKKRTTKAAQASKTVEQAKAALSNGQGNYLTVQVSLKALEGPAENDVSRRQPYPSISTGRRTELAKWITDRRNPLTARVAVNHVWARHFGQPLVDPVDDFGRRTAAPAQQALLDHLAIQFVNGGWRFKDLHRTIVTSHAYRLTTSTRDADPATAKADPNNQHFWRRLPRRMESELVRDSLLHLGGSIDWREGGPSIKPNGQNSASGRRSLYFTHSRDDQHAFLKMFDHADILRCYRRSESIVPQQALTLANSRMALEAARNIAAGMQTTNKENDGDASFVASAFETILSRRPTDDELSACRDVLDQLRSDSPKKDAAEREQRARANLIHALINHNDFVTIR